MKKLSGTESLLRRKREAIAKKLPEIEQTIRGSITRRYIECGKPGCHCHEEGGHGPYDYFVVTKGVGKTISFRIPPEKKKQAKSWVNNYRKVIKGLEKISDLNRAFLSQKQK